jgi:hypothetical protein
MRLRVVVLTCVLLGQSLMFAAPPAQATGATLELSELLPNPAPPQTDEHDEYIEFHNAGSTTVNLKDYGLTIGTTSPKHYKLPDQTVPADGYAAVTAADPTATWALSNSGSSITLTDSAGAQLDAATWPDANSKSGLSWMKSANGTWSWTATPTPGASNQLTANTAPAGPGSSAPAGSGSYPAVELNELFPDPASPLSDAKDEFIELYNPNSFPVDLSGYIIKTGASLSTKHTIGGIVPPAGYLALKSATTKIALANDGSSVALYDPSGAQIGTTITYPKAKTGDAWARSDDAWSWTTSPTPGSANIIAEPPATASTATAAAKKTATKSSATKTTKAKTTTTKAKTTKAKAATKTSTPLVAAATTTGGHWLLFALAGLTIGYIIYEFRYDLRNCYFRLRGYPGRGATPREAVAGRGSDRADERPGGRQDDLRAGTGPWAWLRRRGHKPDIHPESGV